MNTENRLHCYYYFWLSLFNAHVMYVLLEHLKRYSIVMNLIRDE